MGRWTQYDDDSYRLPEGMTRIGYDADSGRYYFRDQDGSVWRGPEGAEYGEMTRVAALPSSLMQPDAEDADVEAASRSSTSGRHSRPDGYQLLTDDPNRPMAYPSRVNAGAYRTLFPFFLIIAVVLLLIWRLVVSPGLTTPPKKQCPEGTLSYWIQPGDSCWEIATKRGWTMDKFREANPKVVCDPLMPGTSVCLPPDSKAGRVVVQQQKEKAKAKAAGSSLSARIKKRS